MFDILNYVWVLPVPEPKPIMDETGQKKDGILKLNKNEFSMANDAENLDGNDLDREKILDVAYF